MEYLGSTLRGDGQADHDLCRRMPMARANFDVLAKTWTHSALTWEGKLRIFSALIETKLLYSLAGLVLTAAQQRKLDGFQSRCLREIVANISKY